MQKSSVSTTKPVISSVGLAMLSRTRSQSVESQGKLLALHNSRVDEVFNEVKQIMMESGFEDSLKAEARDSNQSRYLLKTLSSEGCGCPPCFCSCVIDDHGIENILKDVVHRLQADRETSQKIPAGATFRCSLYTDACDTTHVLGDLYLDWSPKCSVNAMCSRKMI